MSRAVTCRDCENEHLSPADAVEDLDGLGVVFAQFADVELVLLEISPGFQHIALFGTFDDREFVIARGEGLLGLVGGEELQEANGIVPVWRVFHDAGAANIDVRTTVILIGEQDLDLLGGFPVGVVIRFQQANVVVMVGYGDIALAAGDTLDLVGVTAFGVASHVVDHALCPGFGFLGA